MWTDPHDVSTWRAFWRLPDGHADYTEDDWTAWHEWRCSVLEKRHRLGIHYDKAEADRRVNFFRALRHVRGEWAGKRFDPLPWQEQQILRPLYGYLRGVGTRLFREVYGFIPKKNGKTELAAGVVLDQLFMEKEPGCEVYGGAKNSKQAALVFNAVHSMIKKSPPLKMRCKPLEATKRIVIENPTGANDIYEVLSSDVDSKEGPSVQCLVIDEIEVVPQKFLDVMTDGTTAARRQPIKFYIGTGGTDHSLPWVDLLNYAQGVEDGEIENDPAFLPVLYMVRDDEDWESPEVWRHANPSLGVTITLEDFAAEYAKAKAIPAKRASFQRRRLNMLVQDDAMRYLPMDAWDACGIDGDLAKRKAERDKALAELKGVPAVGWLDLSSKTDITTFGLVFPGDPVRVIGWYFLPSENLDARAERDRARYRQWAESGFIELTDGNVTDYRPVRELINRLRDEGYVFRTVAYDDWNAGKLEVELAEEDGFDMIPVPQNISRMNAPTKELLALVMSRKIDHLGDPVLRYMAGNLVVEQDNNERVRPTKAKSTGRIDGIVGIIMALSQLTHELDTDDAPLVIDFG